MTRSWKRMLKIGICIERVMRLTKNMTKYEIPNSELIKKAETRLFKEAQKTITQEEIKRWESSKDQEE
uniref:Fur-regulated basic protein B n=1 Tax=Syphacia muris TaxID=451379 RepID=A0A0N5B1K2_9BILA